MSFADFKKKSKDSVTFLTTKLTEIQNANHTSYKDDRFWSLTKDEKTGNGFAILRLLPAPQNEDLPFVKYYTHTFKGPSGKWFIENCPTTIPGGKCPVCAANSKLWNSGNDADKTIARQRKRRESYVSNVLVVSDPKNKENEGKVALYRYGKKIWEKIQASMYPSDEEVASGTVAINPFDFWTGRSFRLKMKMVKTGNEVYPNYDESGFDNSSALYSGDDKKLEEIWKKEYSLKSFMDPTNYKTYDELQARYLEITQEEDVSIPVSFASQSKPPAPTRTPSASKPAPKTEQAPFDANDGESSLDFFKKLSAADDE